MVITIGRKCGCDGDGIGKELAARYNIPFYDKNYIVEQAKKNGLYEKYPDFYGEMSMDILMHSLAQEEVLDIVRETPKKALEGIISSKDYVLLGRCGNYALKDREDVISVFLTGDSAWRENVIAKKHGILKGKAHNIVTMTDDRRAAYHKYYTGRQWGLAEDYDICINVTKAGIENVPDIIDSYIKIIKKNGNK